MSSIFDNVIWPLIIALGVLFVVMNCAGIWVWVERRLLGFLQDRFGPNRVGPFGLLQPLADVIKLMFKEDWVPPFADKAVFVMAPAIIVVTVLLGFVIVPFAPGIIVANLNIGILFFLGMSSLGVYSLALAGWSSNSKYALIGGMRTTAQMIAYEVFMGLSMMGPVIIAGSFRLGDIVKAQEGMWFCIPQCLGMVLFFIAGLAETHRIPFDIPEAEGELVAGYHSEYSGMKFGIFFVGEYLAITLISVLTVALFLGGWLGPRFLDGLLGPVLPGLMWFSMKTFALICLFILIRAALPRLRYDQLIEFGWKIMLPLSLLNLLVTGAVVLAFR